MANRLQATVQSVFILVIACFSSIPTACAQLPDFTELVKEYRAAVVSINAQSELPEPTPEAPDETPIPEESPFYDFFRRFFGQIPGLPPEEAPVAMGSGFIISSNGHILTSAHVIEGAGQITVRLSDQRELEAKVVGVDRLTDIALLKIEAEGLPTVKYGDSNDLAVGQWVLAMGSPFGLAYTATQGIISALGRSLPTESYVPFIQTDAAVNPGSSGGPLFNLDGEVIGINAQIYSQTGGYMGVSFAIPINVAMDVARQLEKTGKVSRGWLGVVIQEVTPDLARSFGLERPHGALVAEVMPDSPAARAGLQEGDVIVQYGDRPVQDSGQLPPMVGRTRPGTKVPITVIRGGKQQTIEVGIEQLPEEEPAQAAPAQPAMNRLNIAVSPVPEGERQGVLVTEVRPGPAFRAGIRQGDVIRKINQQQITSVTQFSGLIGQLPAGRPIPVLIERDGRPRFLAITLPEQ